MNARFDHIDLRVDSLVAVSEFYRALLPALGFTRQVDVEGWLQYESGEGDFFGVTESRSHIANENRIAFRATGTAAVNTLAQIARDAGACRIEGPMDYAEGYYAVFFEDPCGNRFEICYRI